MKYRIRVLLVTILFFLSGNACFPSSEKKPISLSRFKPQKIIRDFENLGISCEDVFRIGEAKYVVSGVDDKAQDEHDYGIRIYLVEDDKVLFRSKGWMDSWYLNLTFFRSKAPDNRILILAEAGDEGGSYGISVYKLKDSQVKRLGYIGASVWDDNENLLSAVPFIEISKNAGGYLFTFTSDVTVQDERTNEYRTINRQLIKYIYDGKNDIREIIE